MELLEFLCYHWVSEDFSLSLIPTLWYNMVLPVNALVKHIKKNVDREYNANTKKVSLLVNNCTHKIWIVLYSCNFI